MCVCDVVFVLLNAAAKVVDLALHCLHLPQQLHPDEHVGGHIV